MKFFKGKTMGVSRWVMVIVFLGLIVYGNVLNGAFVWDDDAYIKSNAHIKDMSRIGSLFTESVGEGYAGMTPASSFYRPLQMAVYAVAHAFWGLAPAGYNLINILLHIGVALCLFWLIARLFADRRLAGVFVLLYIVHPVHVEAIANTSGTADPLSAFLLLSAFIYYVKAADTSRGRFFVGTVVCFSGALLTKESALVFPFALLLYHGVFKKKIRPLFAVSTAAVCVFYLLLRRVVLGGSLVDPVLLAAMFQRVPVFFAGLAAYAKILVFPVGLHVHYGDPAYTFGDVRVWAGVSLFLLWWTYALKNRRGDPLVLFSTAWFFLFLLPVMNIYRVNDSFIKEHWLYLPSVGFFLILARTFLRVIDGGGDKRRVLGVSGVFLVIVSFAVCTMRMNMYWSDPIVFLERSIRYNPDFAVFYNELGCEREARGQIHEAIGLYLQALARNPGLTLIYLNLARSLAAAGRTQEAVETYRLFLSYHPQYAPAYYAVAGCLETIGRSDEAARWRAQGAEGLSEV